MKQVTTTIAITLAFMLMVFIITKLGLQYTKDSTIERCRINSVIRIDDYQEGRSVYPTEIRWILTTDEGYKLTTRDGNYRVGDSIDIEIIKISNK